jgi:hypothetical protein
MVSHFSDSFELVTPNQDPQETTIHENSLSRPGGAESRFNDQSLIKKQRVADPKIILQKIKSSSY